MAPKTFFAASAALLLGVFAMTAPSDADAASKAQPVATASRIESDIASLSRGGAGAAGSVGVAAWRLDGSGPKVLVNADEAYPMASTFKVAVAGAVLARVDAGELKLDQMIAIDQDRMVPSEVIADRFIHPGVSLSVYNLLELMLTQSDNTATDYMVEAAGGAGAVTAWVRKQGVEGQRIDGDTAEIIGRFFGLDPKAPIAKAWAEKAKADPSLERAGGLPQTAFDSDPKDTSTPRAMADLLTRIFSGKALSPDSTRVIIGIMERCRTGAGRLRGLMPDNTVVAHKTGTIGGTVNDVGVLTLPDGGGQVVIAVFVKASDASEAARERAIAEIARSVRDFYLYQAR